MNIQKIVSWFGSLLFVAIVSGCAQPVRNTPTLSPIIQTSPITGTIDAKTATLMLTPLATNTPIPSTPTDVPTLPAEDARQRLLALLANNNNCRLPCFWGITPGKSHYREARSILLPLSGLAETVLFDLSYPGDGISLQYIEGDFRLNSSVSYLYDKDGIVSRVRFRVLEQQLSKDKYGDTIKTPIYGLPEFIQRVEYYSLSHLLSEQGIPTSVMISTVGPNIRSYIGVINVDLVLLYPDQGIWAHYVTSVDEGNVGNNVKICPIEAHIEMDLYPPGNPDSFYALLDKTDWGVTKAMYKPLNEATSMSVEEFYETFRNPTNQCIETPANIWPTPER